MSAELREVVARAIYEAEPTTDHDDDEKPFIVPWSDIADQWTGYPATYEAMIALADAAIAAARPYIRVAERERCAQVIDGIAATWRGVKVLEESPVMVSHVGAAGTLADAIRSLNND